jgi:two-component system response regulator YcbB
MKKIYLIDDDISVTSILKIIIEKQALGQVCGWSQSPYDALDDMGYLKPDIVIVDLLMPGIDGITFVKKAAAICPDASFVMLSQVSSKDMIARAYDAGVEFFLQKPVNGIEVASVLGNVIRSQDLQQTVDKIQSIFAVSGGEPQVSHEDSGPEMKKLQTILQQLGLTGEPGCRDIVTIVEYYLGHKDELEDASLKDICSRFSDSPKTMEQRIRRTAATGMTNLVHLGLEDYDNDIFVTYANSLYNFEQVRREMDFCRGRTDRHGNVKIKKFIMALIAACEDL